MAGSLSRGEVAELVALVVNGIFLHSNNHTQMHGRYQLGLDPRPRWPMTALNVGENTEADILDHNAGSTPTVSGEQTDSIQNDVWFMVDPHQHGPLEDTASGTGAGPTMHMVHTEIPFRELFGEGPLVDRHHTIYEVMNTEEASGSGNFPSLYRVFTLYWDVQEE